MIFVFCFSLNNCGQGCGTQIRVKQSSASHLITISNLRDLIVLHWRIVRFCALAALFMQSVPSKLCCQR